MAPGGSSRARETGMQGEPLGTVPEEGLLRQARIVGRCSATCSKRLGQYELPGGMEGEAARSWAACPATLL